MTTEPVTRLDFDPSTGTSQGSSAWATVASLGAVDYAELPSDTHHVWFSCRGQNSGDNEWQARVRDTTNSNTHACISVSTTGASTVAAAPTSHTASTLTDYEFQLNTPGGNGTTSLIGSFTVNVWVGER